MRSLKEACHFSNISVIKSVFRRPYWLTWATPKCSSYSSSPALAEVTMESVNTGQEQTETSPPASSNPVLFIPDIMFAKFLMDLLDRCFLVDILWKILP